MPELWSPEIYRLRACEWRQKAEALAAGAECDICLVIADGYARLAELIEMGGAANLQTVPDPAIVTPPN